MHAFIYSRFLVVTEVYSIPCGLKGKKKEENKKLTLQHGLLRILIYFLLHFSSDNRSTFCSSTKTSNWVQNLDLKDKNNTWETSFFQRRLCYKNQEFDWTTSDPQRTKGKRKNPKKIGQPLLLSYSHLYADNIRNSKWREEKEALGVFFLFFFSWVQILTQINMIINQYLD